MGCDIHMACEVRKDGKWELYNTSRGEYGIEAWEPYGNRCYNLFAILANVRNGYGFAGIKTGEGFKPIAEPKGVPEDGSVEGKEFLNSYESDGHSHSYLTVTELMAYDWTQTTQLQGYVDLPSMRSVLYGYPPQSWSGFVSGGNIVHTTEEEVRVAWERLDKPNLWDDTTFQAIRRQLDFSREENVYVLCRWQRSYAQCASEFLSQTLPELWRLGSPEDVRIIFFFDN